MPPRSLQALLTNLIDYAGLYPPAALPLTSVLSNYQRYLDSPQAWMLNRLVLPVDKIHVIQPADRWRLTLLVDREPGPLPSYVETLETKSDARLSLPTYCEVPLDQLTGGYAKIRTTDPSSATLAAFLHEAAARRVPFKATAGLHHAIRAEMHGFINLFGAAAFAFQGMDREELRQALDETDPEAFIFRDAHLQWRGHTTSTAEIEDTRRNFAHSFGSCSFEEPVDELRALGLLA
jgi:hypothetical protein